MTWRIARTILNLSRISERSKHRTNWNSVRRESLQQVFTNRLFADTCHPLWKGRRRRFDSVPGHHLVAKSKEL